MNFLKTLNLILLFVIVGLFVLVFNQNDRLKMIEEKINNSNNSIAFQNNKVSVIKKDCYVPNNWKQSVDTNNKYTFMYPQEIVENNDYIKVGGGTWPPELIIDNKSNIDLVFPCEGLKDKAQNYNVSVFGDGALGTWYSTYDVKLSMNGNNIGMKFEIGFTNCGMYDEPTRSKCSNIKKNFNVDDLIQSILGSVKKK